MRGTSPGSKWEAIHYKYGHEYDVEISLSDIDLGREEEQAVLSVLRTRWLSTGPVTERFEKAFSNHLGGGDAIAVSNGTAALHLALACLGLERGMRLFFLAHLCGDSQRRVVCRGETCLRGYRRNG